MAGTMTRGLFLELLRLTLTRPREAGERVIAMALPVRALWLALALASVLLSLAVTALLQLAPKPPGAQGQIIALSPAYHSPLIFALVQWGQAVITVFVFYWIGRVFGGRGRMADMLAVTVWLQLVTLVMACGLFVLGLVLPALGAMVMLAALIWGLWVTASLIAAAHRFESTFTGALVFLAAIVALALGMMLFAGLLGLTSAGVGQNV